MFTEKHSAERSIFCVQCVANSLRQNVVSHVTEQYMLEIGCILVASVGNVFYLRVAKVLI